MLSSLRLELLSNAYLRRLLQAAMSSSVQPHIAYQIRAAKVSFHRMAKYDIVTSRFDRST